MNWKIRLGCLLADDAGQDLVEYALVAVFIGMGCVMTMKNLVTNVGSVFLAVGTTITSPV